MGQSSSFTLVVFYHLHINKLVKELIFTVCTIPRYLVLHIMCAFQASFSHLTARAGKGALHPSKIEVGWAGVRCHPTRHFIDPTPDPILVGYKVRVG
jgi:hypothetical protein